MGFWSDITGQTAADASKAAAADTYKKQQDAVAKLLGYGDQYASGMGDLAKGFQPWQATGRTANDAVARLIADPSSVRSLPGYEAAMNEGTRAIDRSAAAGGNLFSGRTGKALESFGTNLFDKTYGDQLSRLLGVSEQGRGATAQGVATTGQGLTGQLGARTTAYGGDYGSSGTIGQGDIAAANAKAQGAQGLLNFGGKIIGQGLAAFGGGNPLMALMGGGNGGTASTISYGGSSWPSFGA